MVKSNQNRTILCWFLIVPVILNNLHVFRMRMMIFLGQVCAAFISFFIICISAALDESAYALVPDEWNNGSLQCNPISNATIHTRIQCAVCCLSIKYSVFAMRGDTCYLCRKIPECVVLPSYPLEFDEMFTGEMFSDKSNWSSRFDSRMMLFCTK